MRDFLVVLIVFASVPYTFIRPHIGILVWFWIGLMNPHRLAWGYAQDLRIALINGGATIAAWFISREAKAPPASPAVLSLVALAIWITLAALFAIHPDVAIVKWEEIIKIFAMTFVAICIMQSRDRIEQLVWVIVISIGFYGLRGGIFTILTGGNYRVWGPPDSFIQDNNSLALAMGMILPLMEYLRISSRSRLIRFGLLGSMALTVVAILGTWSRGGLIGLAITLGYFWLKSRRRFSTLLVVVTVAVAGWTLMPARWHERMDTIQLVTTEQGIGQDSSFTERLWGAEFAWRIALEHPLLGGGQDIATDNGLFITLVPEAKHFYAAHDIYLEVLGESGFPGLAFFLCVLLFSFLGGRDIARMTRGREDLAWANRLAPMLQVSVASYAASGAFLSLGFYDLFYAIAAVVVVTQQVVRLELHRSEPMKTFGLNIASTNIGRLQPRTPPILAH